MVSAACAGNAPMKGVNKQRIQNDIGDGPRQHGRHGIGQAAIGVDHVVEHIQQQIEGKAAGNNGEVFRRHIHRLPGCAKEQHQRPVECFACDGQHQADQQRDRNAGAHAFVGFSLSFRPARMLR